MLRRSAWLALLANADGVEQRLAAALRRSAIYGESTSPITHQPIADSLLQVGLRFLPDDVHEIAHHQVHVDEMQSPVGQRRAGTSDIADDVVHARIVGLPI